MSGPSSQRMDVLTGKSLSGVEAAEIVSCRHSEREGPFGDYSQADPEEKPDPNNFIEP